MAWILAKLRLFYVAMTRAKQEIEIPPHVLDLLNITESNAPRHQPAPLAPRRPTSPTVQLGQLKTPWVAPSSWEPKIEGVRRTAVADKPVTEKKKKGLFGWLFGK